MQAASRDFSPLHSVHAAHHGYDLYAFQDRGSWNVYFYPMHRGLPEFTGGNQLIEHPEQGTRWSSHGFRGRKRFPTLSAAAGTSLPFKAFCLGNNTHGGSYETQALRICCCRPVNWSCDPGTSSGRYPGPQDAKKRICEGSSWSIWIFSWTPDAGEGQQEGLARCLRLCLQVIADSARIAPIPAGRSISRVQSATAEVEALTVRIFTSH